MVRFPIVVLTEQALNRFSLAGYSSLLTTTLIFNHSLMEKRNGLCSELSTRNWARNLEKMIPVPNVKEIARRRRRGRIKGYFRVLALFRRALSWFVM